MKHPTSNLSTRSDFHRLKLTNQRTNQNAKTIAQAHFKTNHDPTYPIDLQTAQIKAQEPTSNHTTNELTP